MTAHPDLRPAARVAVVGVGAVTSQGPTAEDLWQGARAGRVAIYPVGRLDMSGYRTKLAGEIDTVPEPRHSYRRPAGFRELALDLALLAAEEVMAGVPAGLVEPERLAVVLGTCNAGLLSGREWLRAQAAGETPDPLLATLVTPQALAEEVAAAVGAGGPVLGVNTACASGANALGLAADLLRLGRADMVLAGGTDALSDVVLAGFNALESLSPEPAAPYSGNRQGLSLGEGSGMLLLVRADLAERYGLRVLAEVGGYGLSADGYDATAPRPDGTGAARAIRAALSAAATVPAEVGYVNGHGTGTPKNDSAETRAIRLALGDVADRTLVSSTKSVIGHLLGAAGVVEAIVTVRALSEQVAPPTAGYIETDPDCDLDYVSDGPKPFTADCAVSNNFAFAGANASLVLNRAGTRRDPAPLPLDRVVVTGMSVLSPAGHDPEAVWRAYAEGRDVCQAQDGLRVGRVVIDPEPYLNRRQRRRMDRLGVLSVISAAKALAAAGFTPGSESTGRVGVLFGTGAGPTEAMERFIVPLLAEGVTAADPAVFPNTVYNQAAGQVAMHLGLYGATSTLSVGHASGAATVSYAADLLAMGQADALVATMTDTLTEELVRAYAALGAVSASPGDGRFPLAEGSVSLVLERRSAALARGATILGEVVASGTASDAGRVRPWDLDGHGMERAMRAALDQARVAPADVTAIWSAAAGLATADRAEARAISRLFGDDRCAPKVHAPKTTLGEPIGAGGALCLALALVAPEAGGPVLVNSSSLGGTHVSLLLRKDTP